MAQKETAEAIPLNLFFWHIAKDGELVSTAVYNSGDPNGSGVIVHPIVNNKILNRHFMNALGSPRFFIHKGIAKRHMVES